MKIRPLSDIHLEFCGYNVPELPEDANTILVLAGDIGVPNKRTHLIDVYIPFLKRHSERFRNVIILMGNHEHYNGLFPNTEMKIEEALDEAGLENVTLLQNRSIVTAGIAFIGATLWTDCGGNNPLANMLFNSMTDSTIIRTGPSYEPWQRKFRASDTYQSHVESLNYIKKEIPLQQAAGNKVVLCVHHGISSKSVAEHFKGDPLNIFYYSELYHELADLNPDLVIHGHMHNFSDYMLDPNPEICKTRVICNPRGYEQDGIPEGTGYNPLLVVDLV